mgnify:CR=1 FL=1
MDKVLKAAKNLGLTVSFDPNFRSTLWSFSTARDVLSKYLPYVDVLIGIEPIHVYNPDGTDVKDGLTMDPSFEDMDRVFKAIDEQYHMKAIARTVDMFIQEAIILLRPSFTQMARLMRARLLILTLLTVLVAETHSPQVLYMPLWRMICLLRIQLTLQ